MAKSLERSLGLWSVLSISLAMIGPGIFVLPGLAVGKTGPMAALAYLFAGLLILPAALSKAELATAIPVTGGAYVYLDRSMGSFVGTIGGIGTWFSLTFKSAFALVGLGAYLSLFLDWPTRSVALVLCSVLIGLNITGVKKSAGFQMGILILLLMGLFPFVGRALPRLEMASYLPFLTHGLYGFVQATGFVFMAYGGVTKIASIVEEVKQPDRNVPLGILLSLVIMMLIYVVVTFLLVGLVPTDTLKKDLTPIASTTAQLFGPIGGHIAAIIGVLALISMANAGVLSSSRYPYAMSRDRLVPRLFSYVHPRLHTPITSILLTGVLMLLLIGFVDVERLAKLSSAFKILVFCLVNLSVIIFRESQAEWYRPRFHCPGYPWVQLIGMVLPLGLIPSMGMLPVLGVVGISVGGVLWYLIYAMRQTDRMGALARTRARARELRTIGAVSTIRGTGKEILLPFFGHEDEAEISERIRIGLLFSLPDGIVHPVFFEEVPDETLLEAIRDADPQAEAFEARFGHATHQWSQQFTLQTVGTHDARLAAFRYASELGARWILLGKQKKSLWDFLIRAHRHWWLHHSPCNVTQFIYRDLREIQRIGVMTEPGPYDALLIHVADRLATVFDAETVLLQVLSENAPESEVDQVRRYHDELRTFFRRAVESQIVRARKRLEKAVELSRNFDLLIVGAPAEDQLVKVLVRKPFEERLADRAACSVFVVQSPRAYSHEVAPSVPERIRTEGFRIFPFLHQALVEAGIEVADKEELFAYISKRFAEETGVCVAREIEQAFWHRERIQNTAMGQGVAMPHAVIPRCEHTLLGLFTLQRPIDFQSPDGSKVDVCFVTVGPADQRSIHLKILGRVAFLVRQTDLLKRIHEVHDHMELTELIMSLDAQDI